LVNGLIDKELVQADVADFVRHRVEMQDEHMAEIWNIFGDKVRAVVPLFETEVRGTKMMNRLVDKMFLPEP